MALEHGHGLQSWELAVAKKLIGEFRRGSQTLADEEFDDLLQDCLVHWIEVRHKIGSDSDRPPLSFMARVIRNKLTDRARKRGALRWAGDFDAVSLDATIEPSEDGPTLFELIASSESSQLSDPTEFELQHARIDLRRAMRHLTPAQRRLCKMLGDEGASVTEIAEQLCVSSVAIYSQMRRIRKVFAKHGLGKYLKG